MHPVLDAYTLIVAALVVAAVGLLGFRAGISLSSKRITRRLKTDRDFGIAVLEDLAGRWGVKVEHQETPGGP